MVSHFVGEGDIVLVLYAGRAVHGDRLKLFAGPGSGRTFRQLQHDLAALVDRDGSSDALAVDRHTDPGVETGKFFVPTRAGQVRSPHDGLRLGIRLWLIGLDDKTK